MKTLRRLLFFVLLLTGLAYGWFRQSLYGTLWEIGRAAEQRDVDRLERYVDLDALVDSAPRFAAAMARAEGNKLGGALLGSLLGGVADVLGTQLGNAVKPDAVRALRAELREGYAFRELGPFTLHDGVRAIAGVSTAQHEGKVRLAGTCDGNPAELEVRFVRIPGPFDLDVVGHWRASALDEQSLVKLARDCLAKAKDAPGT